MQNIPLFKSRILLCGTDGMPRSVPGYSPNSKVVFPNILHIQSECGDYLGLLRGILSVPHNHIMDMENVMNFQSSSYHYFNLLRLQTIIE